jgi:glycerophosphoryl diester phosphodiesterase
MISPRKSWSVILITLGGFALFGLLTAAGEVNNIFLRGAGRPRPVLNIAHAGAASLAPQNTLAAGWKAFQVGADLWGIDTRLTSDGVFVLMHDATLNRTTDVESIFPERAPWRVDEFTVSELKLLDAGSWFVETDPFSQIASGEVPEVDQHAYVGEVIPTLREALEFTRVHDWRIDIEVKAMGNVPKKDIAQQLVVLIAETGMQSQVLVSSFDHELLREVKGIDPRIPIAGLVILAPWNPVEYLEELGADVYAPSPVGFTSGLVARLGALGFGVHLWTYNDVSQLEHFAAAEGVSGIYTDFPQRLEPVLDELFGADAN